MNIGKIYTVTISTNEPESLPWVTPFSNRTRAYAFKKKAEAKLRSYNVEDVTVSVDSAELDSDSYLDWIDEEYGN